MKKRAANQQWRRYEQIPLGTNRPERLDSILEKRMREFVRIKLARYGDAELI